MDSLYLFGSSIRVSQALAAVLFIACTALLVYFAIKKPTKPLYYKEPVAAEGENEKKKDNSKKMSDDSKSEDENSDYKE